MQPIRRKINSQVIVSGFDGCGYILYNIILAGSCWSSLPLMHICQICCAYLCLLRSHPLFLIFSAFSLNYLFSVFLILHASFLELVASLLVNKFSMKTLPVLLQASIFSSFISLPHQSSCSKFKDLVLLQF